MGNHANAKSKVERYGQSMKPRNWGILQHEEYVRKPSELFTVESRICWRAKQLRTLAKQSTVTLPPTGLRTPIDCRFVTNTVSCASSRTGEGWHHISQSQEVNNHVQGLGTPLTMESSHTWSTAIRNVESFNRIFVRHSLAQQRLLECSRHMWTRGALNGIY